MTAPGKRHLIINELRAASRSTGAKYTELHLVAVATFIRYLLQRREKRHFMKLLPRRRRCQVRALTPR
jgi:hypothetical protein